MAGAPRAAALLRRALLAWFRAERRDLPWRRTRDAYGVWLSEIMLQQTRVETVLPYYARFLEAFPDVRALAAAPLPRVLKLWEGLGYYTRARNLHRAANVIVRERGGVFPGTAAEWQALPGIGRYTAGAIASIALDEAVPVVDGNVKRVLARVFRIEASIDSAATQARIWALAEGLLAKRSPGDFNQALMELGARICTPRGPRCGACPVARWCAARAAGRQERLPVRGWRRAVPEVTAVAAVVERGGRVLLVRRPERGLLAGLWTLPMVEVGGADDRALEVGLERDLGLVAHPEGLLGTVTHVFSHRRLVVRVVRCRARGDARHVTRRLGGDGGRGEGGRAAVGCAAGRGATSVWSEPRWVRRSDLGMYPCAAVDRKLFALLG